MEVMVERPHEEKEKKKKKTNSQASGSRRRRPSPVDEDHYDEDDEERIVKIHSESSEDESNPRAKERDQKWEDFQKQLNALKLQGNFKELGVSRPYPSEWDAIPYPPKFKPLNLV